MPRREDENPDLNPLCTGDPLARQLAVLQPMPSGLNRDQLLYAAGSAARDRDVSFWRRLFVGQCVAVVGLVGGGSWLMDWKGTGRPADQPYVAAPASNQGSIHKDEQAAPSHDLDDNIPAFPSGPRPQFAGTNSEEVEHGDLGRLLQLRADVFAAGLGVLPTPSAPPPRADATALEKSLQLPPGVLAAPYKPATPKPPEPKESD